MTKQSETRDLVLDLIEQLEVGEAIPSERQLSADLGVSRLTLRAALDDLAREGYVVRRRGAGTFVGEPKIAQELTMTSFTDDMRRRGLRPSSRTLELRVSPAGARLGRLLHVSPSEPVVIASRLRLADGESMAIETVHVRRDPHSGTHRARSGGEVVLRDPPRSLRHRRRRRNADDRADGDRRGRVGGARRSAPLAGVPLRAGHPLGHRRDRRVRGVDLPRRQVPARHRPLRSPGASSAKDALARRAVRRPRVGEGCLAWLVPHLAWTTKPLRR